MMTKRRGKANRIAIGGATLLLALAVGMPESASAGPLDCITPGVGPYEPGPDANLAAESGHYHYGLVRLPGEEGFTGPGLDWSLRECAIGCLVEDPVDCIIHGGAMIYVPSEGTYYVEWAVDSTGQYATLIRETNGVSGPQADDAVVAIITVG
jgi:hypothetical protein